MKNSQIEMILEQKPEEEDGLYESIEVSEESEDLMSINRPSVKRGDSNITFGETEQKMGI